jgi:hypothetical protein
MDGNLESEGNGWFHDPACHLYPGDHEFIRRKSYVNYRLARIEPAEKLLRGVSQGAFIPKTSVNELVFARICQGLLDSRFAAPVIKDFYMKAQNQK